MALRGGDTGRVNTALLSGASRALVDKLARWQGGVMTYQLAAPPGPWVGGYHLERYLLKTGYFARNPRNFDHLKQCVQRPLNPAGGNS